MNILGFDTALARETVLGLSLDNGDRSELHLSVQKSQEAKLLLAVDALLTSAGQEISDISLLAVGIGPGSFTGLRIGISTARALARSLSIPLVGVSTLELIAASFPDTGNGVLVPVIDARMKRVFTAAFKNGKRLFEDSDLYPEDLSERLLSLGQKNMVLIGNGAEKYAEIFSEIKGFNVQIWPEVTMSGKKLCEIAAKRADQGDIGAIESVIPAYLRRSEAEIQWEKRNK